mmetsp:Transcript_6055/g.8401  ORF Transcript_6055/g.8401 Transcript_6055/m.8401 type:complete len:121 (-) Transcript_6055:122-484(-)
MDEKRAAIAEKKQVVQEIDHREEDQKFVVKMGHHVRSYDIGGSDQLKEAFGNTMSWEGEILVSRPSYMNKSPGAVETRRKLHNGKMILTMNNGKEMASRHFERIDLVKPVNFELSTSGQA